MFLGAGWEVFEIIFNNIIAGNSFDLPDTLSDIFFDLSGGLCAILYILVPLENQRTGGKKKIIILILALVLMAIFAFVFFPKKNTNSLTNPGTQAQADITQGPQASSHPLQISEMRKKEYPGSEITVERELNPGSNYKQYLASYRSEGFKIFALLTVPNGIKPESGWPAIIFNHGYIAPATYVTTERYVTYVDAFARNGYIVFKPDYRGHGKSEGKPEGAYYSHAYATDVLNALSTLKQYKVADPTRIGMWGHSMGGNIILRDSVVNTKDIKAAVIWGGVVAPYDDLLNN